MSNTRKRGPQNPDRDKMMATIYQEGLTLEEVGQVYGITRQRVQQILKRENVQRTYHQTISIDLWERQQSILGLHHQGLMVKEIAEKLNISYGTAIYTLRKSECTLRKGKRPSEKRRESEEKAIELYQSGLSCNKVALETDLSAMTVWNILVDHSIPRRTFDPTAPRGKRS